jgi:hypothetical protein
VDHLKSKLAPLREADAVLKSASTAPPSQDVHVFIDLSNITIGFYDSLKINRGMDIKQRIRAPPFSFENLATILERGRPIAKKVVAGSVIKAYNRRWPQYMQEAQDLGYEMNIMQRVTKATPSPGRRLRRGKGESGRTTSGADTSNDDTIPIGPLKQGEQGVDELLHLKIMQSIVDHQKQPGTMVLATGDAAEAEFSDGFKKNVERALGHGWNVELVAWKKGISSSWRDPLFASTWIDRFRIIELDAYVEELLAIYADSTPAM